MPLLFLLAGFTTYGIIDPKPARIFIAIAGFILLAAIITSDYLFGKSWKHVALVAATSSGVIFFSLYHLDTWAVQRKKQLDAKGLSPPFAIESKKEAPGASPSEPPKPAVSRVRKAIEQTKMEDPFSVAEEIAFLSHGGNKFGTRFWLRVPAPWGCVLYQAQAVIFLRIENVRPYPVTIISYNIEAIKPLIRLSAFHHLIFGIGAPGESFYGATRIGEVVPARQGPGMFAMSYIPFNGLAFNQAKLLEMDVLDEQIIKPLAPNVPLRGWAFFEYPVDDEYFMMVMPQNLTITIKTDRGESFSYPLPLQYGDPNGDILPRDMKIKDIVDVSNCLRQRYEIPRWAASCTLAVRFLYSRAGGPR